MTQIKSAEDGKVCEAAGTVDRIILHTDIDKLLKFTLLARQLLQTDYLKERCLQGLLGLAQQLLIQALVRIVQVTLTYGALERLTQTDLVRADKAPGGGMLGMEVMSSI